MKDSRRSWARRVTAARKGGLAGVRQPDEAGVGDELQPEPDPAFVARLAGIGVARRAVGRDLKCACEAAVAPPRQHHAIAVLVRRRQRLLSSSKICVPTGT